MPKSTRTQTKTPSNGETATHYTFTNMSDVIALQQTAQREDWGFVKVQMPEGGWQVTLITPEGTRPPRATQVQQEE